MRRQSGAFKIRTHPMYPIATSQLIQKKLESGNRETHSPTNHPNSVSIIQVNIYVCIKHVQHSLNHFTFFLYSFLSLSFSLSLSPENRLFGRLEGRMCGILLWHEMCHNIVGGKFMSMSLLPISIAFYLPQFCLYTHSFVLGVAPRNR